MQEVLFSSSPIDTILSILGFLLVITFPLTIGQKTRVKQLPKPLQHFIITIQAMAWVQAGDATRHVAEISFTIRKTPLWRLKHILSEFSVILLTFLFCLYPETMNRIFGWPFLGLDQHPSYTAYGILFLVFVIPELFMTFYMMLKRSLQTSDQTLIQINAYMLTTFAFAVFFPMLLDFVVPLTYSFQHTNDHVSFLQWFQYCTIFIAILCGQYFTSVSFKNKSSWWFLNGFAPTRT